MGGDIGPMLTAGRVLRTERNEASEGKIALAGFLGRMRGGSKDRHMTRGCPFFVWQGRSGKPGAADGPALPDQSTRAHSISVMSETKRPGFPGLVPQPARTSGVEQGAYP